jgi:hypothetical protein
VLVEVETAVVVAGLITKVKNVIVNTQIAEIMIPRNHFSAVRRGLFAGTT